MMKKTIGPCLLALFLSVVNARAQTPHVAYDDAFRTMLRELKRTTNLSSTLLLASAHARPQVLRQLRPKRTVNASRTGALIGAVAGTAAAAAYFVLRGCPGGSDSMGVWTMHCIVPSGGMIAAGWILGSKVP